MAAAVHCSRRVAKPSQLGDGANGAPSPSPSPPPAGDGQGQAFAGGGWRRRQAERGAPRVRREGDRSRLWRLEAIRRKQRLLLIRGKGSLSLKKGGSKKRSIAEAHVPISFVYGSGTNSRKTSSCHKCRASMELTLPCKELRKSSQLIHYREFFLPQSSLKELACQQLAHGMDEQWPYHSSCPASVSRGQYPVKKGTVKQVQDHQPCPPQGDAYFTGLSQKESDRRRKIGAANKGKVPWTKGRKWSEEQKKLIKQRTVEALRDPKVRKKMLGHRQLHRQTSKDKISAALRTIWERRIVPVQSRQKVLQIWSNSIAEAAKNGDHSQSMLEWDSYERIKSEMISMFLWNKERGRIVKKLKMAVAKIAAKRLQAARRSKEQATGIKASKREKLKPEKMSLQNSDRQPTQVVVSAKPKLKERLAKWHGRKKELETVISLRARKRGLRKAPRRQMASESLEAPSTPAAGTSVI